MNLFGILLCFTIGATTAIGVIAVFRKELVIDAVKHLQRYTSSLTRLRQEKHSIQQEIKSVQGEIQTLNSTLAGFRNERDLIEEAFAKQVAQLENSSRVDSSQALVYGRGRQWVYAYTFPSHEELAHAKKLIHHPMKIGMSAQDSVIRRIEQQVAGNSTALAERAAVRLVFRVNDARSFEQWVHQFLARNQRKVADSIGVEWFRTNPTELVLLFQSFVLGGATTVRVDEDVQWK